MKRHLLLGVISLFVSIVSFSQLCPGGGLTFATAAAFSQSWNTNCPGTGVTHSNLVACEPTTALDACAPAPLAACVSGTTGSDLWYFFYAGATSLSIVVNPNFKGQKQFEKVLNWAKQFAGEKNLKFVRMDTWADNEKIIDYYKSFGFEFIEYYKTTNAPELPIQNRDLNVALLELSV